MMNDALKRLVAEEAAREVQSGQILGLGTGSTSSIFVHLIGERYRRGELRDLIGVPTSEATRAIAESYGIPLAAIETHAVIDFAVDGCDEVDPQLDLIKGLGGALLREKAVEIKARRFVVITDDSKIVEKLGTKSPVPVEVARDGWKVMIAPLAAFGCTPVLRGGEADPKITDGGNVVLDCRFAHGIDDARALGKKLDVLPGVLAHGLFLNMANEVIVSSASGVRRILAR
jgi:ribose 5-phosphate isomerase A